MRYVLAAVACLAAATAFADCDQHGPSADQLKQELNLNDAQATQVQQILSAGHDKMRALHETERENMRTQMDAIHQDTLGQLRGVLSDDQIQTLESQMKAHMGWHGHHGPDSGDDAPGA